MEELNKLENWKLEVSAYLSELNNKLKTNEKTKDLYYGFDVIDGKIIMNPDFLFIGINPGAGDKVRDHEITLETDAISYLDIYDDDYKYQLAKETIEVFRTMGMSDEKIYKLLQDSCVKTNQFYISTDSEADIKKCLNASNETNYGDYWKKSIEFTIALIKIIKPKIVVFEGKSAYDSVVEICYEIKDTWDADDLAHFYSKEDDAHFVGYKRLFSNIKTNKEKLSNKFKEILA